jgi:hypothetical protein
MQMKYLFPWTNLDIWKKYYLELTKKRALTLGSAKNKRKEKVDKNWLSGWIFIGKPTRRSETSN